MNFSVPRKPVATAVCNASALPVAMGPAEDVEGEAAGKGVSTIPELGGTFPCKPCISSRKREKKRGHSPSSLGLGSGLDLPPLAGIIKASPAAALGLGSRQQGSASLSCSTWARDSPFEHLVCAYPRSLSADGRSWNHIFAVSDATDT